MKNVSSFVFALVVFTPVLFTPLFSTPFLSTLGPASASAEKLWTDPEDSKPLIDVTLPSLAPVVEKLGAAVVNISIEGRETAKPAAPKRGPRFGGPNPGGEPFSPFDFFSPFPEPPGGRPFTSLGSGFVINPSGYILTNNHVVEKATKIVVSFRDEKKTYRATVVGRDEKTDLALLKVEGHPSLSSAVMGDSSALKPGDWVIAIGNPFRLGHTVTLGIVSAKSRRVGAGPYEDYIQTDASINPGNSGGPLFNIRGEVVGINTAIFSPGRFGGGTGFNIGIGFATPINLAKEVLNQLHDKGKVVRGWLGVLIQPVSPDVADAMNLKQAEGALVADVVRDSPAEKAGFQRGDVITMFDGKKVESNDDLPLMVAQTKLGKTVEIELTRNGKQETKSVEIKELKDEEEAEPQVEEAEESNHGLTVQELTPDLARSLGIEEVGGLLVSDVQAGSPAEEAGFRRGDVVLEMNGKAVNTRKPFRETMKGLKPNKPLLFLIRREDNTIFLTLKLD